MAQQVMAQPGAARQTQPQPRTDTPYINIAQMRRDLATRRAGKVLFGINAMASYFFLWAPIVILVVFSFNNSRSIARWDGFTLQWYTNIFNTVAGSGSRASTSGALDALGNSLIIGLSSTIIATLLATALALALQRYRFPGKNLIDGVLYLPVVIPEIAQAVSLVLFFQIVFDYATMLSGTTFTRGFGTVIIGHVVFSVAFVVIVIRARLADMNPRFEEAARDLGANEWKTFSRVTLPLLLPGIVAGALLAFTLSLDDYLITAYAGGVGTSTLTVFVFGLMRRGVSPEINAISTIMMVLSVVLVGLSLILQGRNAATTSV